MPDAAGSLLTLAAGSGEAAPLLVPLLVGLLGGLALFLFGLDHLSQALKATAGDRMRALLARLTRNRVTGAVTGAIATAAIQSSSVTTVLVVGFITAGLMTLTQSVGVIMGANIGSTFTAQILAFHIEDVGLALVAVGFALAALGRRERTKRFGAILLGLGLIFFGMKVMGDAMRPLRAYGPFLDVMARLENPLYGILAGTVFTALVQSSAATAGVVIVLAAQGLVSLDAGIALVFGANIGTCVTAVLASLGKPPEARRAALVHVLFNVLGVLLWVGFIEALGGLVVSISPAGDVPRQIANAHTIFNVANTLLLLPFAGVFARVATALIPDRGPAEVVVRPKYLDSELVSMPSLALDRVRLEILRLADRAKAMLIAILPAMISGRREDLDRVAAMDGAIDVLHGAIVNYLGEISRGKLTQKQTADLVHLMDIANDLENIGDIIETNLVGVGRRRLDLGVTISPSTQEVIENFHAEVLRALDTSQLAVTQTNVDAARVVTGMKADINRMAEAAARHGADRLVAPEPHRIASYQIETGMLENLKRIYYFAKRMARVVVPRDRGS
ncbi:MAG: Na/Pi cotransporter family protein [Planctomycetota bacterium]